MNNTSYDDIFECFINNCGVSTDNLPKSNEGKYSMINNAVDHYNSLISSEDSLGKIVCDNMTEFINLTLDGTRLLILVYCMKYVYLENDLVAFEELWSPFIKEGGGIQQYKSQTTSRENTLVRIEQKINQLLTSIEDASIM